MNPTVRGIIEMASTGRRVVGSFRAKPRSVALKVGPLVEAMPRRDATSSQREMEKPSSILNRGHKRESWVVTPRR
jgi:hypothetical protein